MISTLLNNFPAGYEPNTQQIKLLKAIDQAFDDGFKFVVCNAPTGSGKSFISKTVSNIADNCSDNFKDLITSYVAYKRGHEDDCADEPAFGCTALTITKSLQDQYKSLFDDIEILKGKSNYQCAIDDSFSVEVAPCMHLPKMRDECWAKHKCPYYEQRNKALTSKFSSLNYTMFFSLPDHLKKRQYLICDEASELEDQLVKEFTCRIEFATLKKLEVNVRPFYTKNSANTLNWINTLAVDINDRINDLEEIIRSIPKSKEKLLINKRGEIIRLRNIHSKLVMIIDTWNDSEYVYEKNAYAITFMPLKVDKIAYRLFDHADKVILLSATIIDPANFCKSLGIRRFKYVEAESTFDPKNAPIFCNTKVKLNYYSMAKNLPVVINQIKQICEHHKDEKGIVHTHNNSITKSLMDSINDSRFLFREPGIRNENILQQHFESDKPTVLVSPSMSFGVDLKDELARFQIIVKAPFLPTNDTRVENLMKEDPNWYFNKMLCSLIQSCGRGIRSKKDHCVTYILDATIVEAIVKNKHKLPKYFLERFS